MTSDLTTLLPLSASARPLRPHAASSAVTSDSLFLVGAPQVDRAANAAGCERYRCVAHLLPPRKFDGRTIVRRAQRSRPKPSSEKLLRLTTRPRRAPRWA